VSHDFDYGILDAVAHRPWPMPDRPWVMTQTWHDLLFAHWPLDPGVLRPLVPPSFPLDLADGAAWLGVVPFRMTNVAPRAVPALPWISHTPELNVRTYVRVDGRPGVWFFSLDAARVVAVKAARWLFNLPYHVASMDVAARGHEIACRSARPGAAPATFTATYRPCGAAFQARPASLEHFLTERYCLYHVDRRGRPYRLEIHHPPWSLQPADAQIHESTVAAAAGVELPPVAPLLHFARRQDMVGWLPERLE
jgi:uncharacterized protein